jgi:copper chaperone
METLKFKTNIKCGGCIAAITPFLDKMQEIEKWEVDTVNPDKVLTVKAEGISAEDVIATVREAGYTAETIKT